MLFYTYSQTKESSISSLVLCLAKSKPEVLKRTSQWPFTAEKLQKGGALQSGCHSTSFSSFDGSGPLPNFTVLSLLCSLNKSPAGNSNGQSMLFSSKECLPVSLGKLMKNRARLHFSESRVCVHAVGTLCVLAKGSLGRLQDNLGSLYLWHLLLCTSSDSHWSTRSFLFKNRTVIVFCAAGRGGKHSSTVTYELPRFFFSFLTNLTNHCVSVLPWLHSVEFISWHGHIPCLFSWVDSGRFREWQSLPAALLLY